MGFSCTHSPGPLLFSEETRMKTCNLDDFLTELQPWLDNNHIRKAHVDEQGHFVLLFRDGMKNVYNIDDCNRSHIDKILKDLASRGISTSA